MTTAEQPAWPLAKRGTADLFKPQAVRHSTRAAGRSPSPLMFASVIIGSVPRMGKTFLLRLLLLICALDLRAEMHAYDLKGTGDLEPLRARSRTATAPATTPRTSSTWWPTSGRCAPRCGAAPRSSGPSPTSTPSGARRTRSRPSWPLTSGSACTRSPIACR